MGEHTGPSGGKVLTRIQCSGLYEQGVVLELCVTLKIIPSCGPVRRGGSVEGINETRVVIGWSNWSKMVNLGSNGVLQRAFQFNFGYLKH